MQTRQGTMLDSLQNVQAFLDKNAEKLSGVVKTGARQMLADAIEALATHASDQSSSQVASEGAPRKQLALRQALVRDHMQPIVRIARADLPPTPEVEALRIPRGKPTPQRLAAAAHGMAKAARPFTAQFIAAGLPADFIEQLNSATEAMIASGHDRQQNRGVRSGATVGLGAKLTAGRKIVHVLDAFVTTALQDDAPLLASWNAVKRVRRASSGSAPTPTPTPAPTPTPTHPPAPVTP
jgi:hypothetical protein